MAVLSKKRRTVVVLANMSIIDHGPAAMHANKHIMREDRPDIDAPNRLVLGSRRRDGLRIMWARGHVSEAQWVGAEMFRADLERAAGASDKQDNGGIRASSHSYGPTDLQCDAQARVRGALQAVGIILGGVLSWVVISRGTLDDYATCKSVKRQRAGEMLGAALDKLADYYSNKSHRK